MNRPKKNLKGDVAQSQGGLSESSPLRSDGLGAIRWEAGPHERWPKMLKIKLKGGHQALAYSDQMVLVMARQEANSG